MGRFIDKTGMKIGRLTVLERAENAKPPNGSKQIIVVWKCLCDCGNIVYVRNGNLGVHTFSCGCYKKECDKEYHTKHGQAYSRIYNIYNHMIRRCFCKNTKYYRNYGARGITVCDEWKNSFQSFYDWSMANGYDDSLSIDRIDNNGNYEPDNCRWTDRYVQSRNKRTNTFVEYNGRRMILTDFAREVGIPHPYVSTKTSKGFAPEQIIKMYQRKIDTEKPKKIYQLDMEGNIVNEYMSGTIAAKEMSCTLSNISSCCRGKSKTCKGYKWRYADDYS